MGDKFLPSSYDRIASLRNNQAFYFNQAKVCSDEQNVSNLYKVLRGHASLLPESISHPKSYLQYGKEKFHHKKILSEFSKDQKIVMPLVFKHPDETATKDDGNSVGMHDLDDFSPLSSDVHDKMDTSIPAYKVRSCGWSVKDYKINVNVGMRFSPSPIRSYIENPHVAAQVSHITFPDSSDSRLGSNHLNGDMASKLLKDVHIAFRLMDDFLELASTNTKNNLETCGVLGALLKDEIFYVTTLIIPKQESTSDSCQALNEEEIYALQEELSLFPVGWIHTHPSQSCFMSSIDLHTQYSYQLMLPEAVSIVLAPTDSSRKYGIFRLTDPCGIKVVKECNEQGFHSHQQNPDDSPLYEYCSNYYMNPNLRFEIIDIRNKT